MLRAMARMLQQSRSADISTRPRVIGVLSPGDEAAIPIVDAITTRLGSYGQDCRDRAAHRPDRQSPTITTNSSNCSAKPLIERSVATTGSSWWPTEDRATCGDDMSSRKATGSWSWWINRHPPDGVDHPVTQGPVHLITCVAEPDPSWWDAAAAGLASPRQRRRLRLLWPAGLPADPSAWC